MSELLVLISVVVYGCLMFALGSMTDLTGETKAKVSKTPDKDPRKEGYDAPPTRNNPNR